MCPPPPSNTSPQIQDPRSPFSPSISNDTENLSDDKDSVDSVEEELAHLEKFIRIRESNELPSDKPINELLSGPIGKILSTYDAFKRITKEASEIRTELTRVDYLLNTFKELEQTSQPDLSTDHDSEIRQLTRWLEIVQEHQGQQGLQHIIAYLHSVKDKHIKWIRHYARTSIDQLSDSERMFLSAHAPEVIERLLGKQAKERQKEVEQLLEPFRRQFEKNAGVVGKALRMLHLSNANIATSEQPTLLSNGINDPSTHSSPIITDYTLKEFIGATLKPVMEHLWVPGVSLSSYDRLLRLYIVHEIEEQRLREIETKLQPYQNKLHRAHSSITKKLMEQSQSTIAAGVVITTYGILNTSQSQESSSDQEEGKKDEEDLHRPFNPSVDTIEESINVDSDEHFTKDDNTKEKEST